MATSKKAAPKKAAKKVPVIKKPVIPFNNVLLRGDGFKQHDKEIIFKYMQLKQHKQATSAVVDAVHGWFRQADTIQQLIKDKNDLIDQLAKCKANLKTLHVEVGEVLNLEEKYNDRKSNLAALFKDLLKVVPAGRPSDQDDDDHDNDWDADFDDDDE